MKQKIIFILCLLAGQLAHDQVVAQCKDNVYDFLDMNNVSARYNNGGTWFWDNVSLPAYEVPKGSGQHVSFASSLWVGGLDPQGGLHVSAATYRQSGWEWYTGPYRQPQGYACPTTIEASSGIFFKGIKRLSNGKLLVLTANEVLIHDLQTHQTLVRTLPAPRLWMDAIELPDGRIFLFGDDVYPTQNPVLFMDTVNYAITGGPILNWFHKESSISLMQDGNILLAGVIGCEVFDPTTNLSTAVPEMVFSRMKHDALTLDNGDVMTFGGGASLGGTGLTIFTQYYRDDGSTNFWYQGPAMSTGRQRAIAVRMPDGKIFISGGNSSSNLTDIYDQSLNVMLPGAPLPEMTNLHSVSVLDSENVLIGLENTATNSAKLFKFNIYNGNREDVQVQIGGPRSFLLDSTTVLFETHDNKRLQKMDLTTKIQDDDRWQYIWKVSRAEIDQFKADFLANTVDFARYPHIETWPAHGDEGLGEDRNLAPFVDVNNDGLYRPGGDGDYPCITGDQALWWVFNDQGPHTETNSIPLGLQVEAMAYSFDCSQTTCPDTSLDYTTFLHLEITNHSDTAYHGVYIGNLQDADVGDFTDDYIACDTVLNMAIAYNSDDNDSVYGARPPAWGAALVPNSLIDSMNGVIFYDNLVGTYNSVPETPTEFYNYLNMTFRDGLHLVDNGLNGYSGTAPGTNTNFMFPSTQGFCGGPMTGWSEVTANSVAGYRRILQSFGPLDLQPGEKTQLDLSFVYARGSSNLQSVCALKTATATIQNWWQNQLDRGCFNTVVSRDESAQPVRFRAYPNPSGLGYVEVDWSETFGEGSALELIDLQGRLLQRKDLAPGESHCRLSLPDLPAGIYLLRLSGAGDVQVQRLMLE